MTKGPKVEGLEPAEYAVADFVHQQLETTDAHHNHYEPIWTTCYRLWSRYRAPAKEGQKRRSRLFIPLVFNMIETLLPLMMLTLFSVKDFIDVKPFGIEDQPLAKRIRRMLEYQIPHIPEWFIKMSLWVKNCLMYGGSTIKMYWSDDQVEVPVYEYNKVLGVSVGRTIKIKQQPVLDAEGKQVIVENPETGEPDELTEDVVDENGEKVNETKMVGYVGPNFEVIPGDKFFHDAHMPSGGLQDNVRWCADERLRPLSYFLGLKDEETGEPLLRNLDVIKKMKAWAEDNESDQETATTQSTTTASDQDSEDFNKMLLLTDYWGCMKREALFAHDQAKVDSMSKEDREEIVYGNIMMVNRSVPGLIRENEGELFNRQKPYINIYDTIDPKSSEGTGDIEPAISYQHEANNNRNQWLEAMRRALNGRKYVNNQMEIDEHALLYGAAGSIVKMQDINGIKDEVNTFDFNAAIGRDSVIKTEFQETTSTFPHISGSEAQGDQKASIYLSFEKAALKKFSYRAMLIEHMGIREFARWLMILNAKYQTDEMVVRILGTGGGEDTFDTITVEEMSRQFDYVAVGSASEPLSSIPARQQNLQLMLETFLPYNGIINIQSVIQQWCEVHGIRDWQEIFNNPAEEWFSNMKASITQLLNATNPETGEPTVSAEEIIKAIMEQPQAIIGDQQFVKASGAPGIPASRSPQSLAQDSGQATMNDLKAKSAQTVVAEANKARQ